MKVKGISSKSPSSSSPGYFWLAALAGIPIFMAALFYTRERMNDNEEITAFPNYCILHSRHLHGQVCVAPLGRQGI